MSSVATTIPRPCSIFREEQFFAWWTYVFMGMWAIASSLAPAFFREVLHIRSGLTGMGLAVTLIGIALPVLLIVGVLRMTTEVTATELRVWFGWLPTYRQELPLAQIRSVEVVRYRAIHDYGFWGVRRGRDGEYVLSARGDRGVRLTLGDGSRLLIGSQRPEELARILDKAIPREP
ncbi:MAG: hypothetical protein U0800_23505 [Isosphaeraceae bacterium]